MKDKIWTFLSRNHPEGCVLSRPLIIARAILYPLETFYWHMNERTGYNWKSDTWTINGVEYSGAAMRQLAKAQGGIYKITRTGKTLTVEQQR